MNPLHPDLIVHAGAVAFDRRAVLILGPSGSGKSSLALELMSRGASLVSDDRTILRLKEGFLLASPPDVLRGRIEARGVGLIGTHHVSGVPVILAVDLGRMERERLPERRRISFMDVEVDLVYGRENAALAAAIVALAKGARVA